MSKKDDILKAVTAFYLNSSDFNGLPTRILIAQLGLTTSLLKKNLILLIQQDRVSVEFGDVHPNPHIKAFKELPAEEQIAKLQKVDLLVDNPCVYPSPAHLKTVVNASEYQGKPFTLRLALGEPQLAFESFDVRVLEFYRNDPRYYYTCDDISGEIGIKDEYYLSEAMPSADHILLQTFGFSYNSKLNRAVAVFLRYLSDLRPEHQQIWNARIVTGDYQLHPDYRRTSFGHWPEGVSIFEAFIEEQHVINDMCKLMGRPAFFRNELGEGKKPRGLSFLIRPTLKEYNDFVLLLDKAISDNINKKFFLNDVPLEREEVRKDGKIIVREKGTLQLLEEWLNTKIRVTDRQPMDEMIASFKEIRKQRQHPAHAIDDDAFDQKYFEQQREMIIKAYSGLRVLRLLFTNHRNVKGYEVPDWLQEGNFWTY